MGRKAEFPFFPVFLMQFNCIPRFHNVDSRDRTAQTMKQRNLNVAMEKVFCEYRANRRFPKPRRSSELGLQKCLKKGLGKH